MSLTEPESIRSDRGKRIVRLKRERTLDLFLKRGEFWREVQIVRREWGIDVKQTMPPERDWRLPPGYGGATWPVLASAGARWDDEIEGLIGRVIPPEVPGWLKYTWHEFLDACAFYDPPETHLLEFANIGGPEPMDVKHPGPVKWPPASNEELEELLSGGKLKMEAPPVEKVADADEAVNNERWLYGEVLDRLVNRLEPQGIDLWKLVREVWANSDDLREEYWRRWRENVPRLYIEVDGATTKKDAENARRLIQQALREKPSGGRPRVDDLVALQLALLYDRHNTRDADDKRFKEWTYEKLAKRFAAEGVKNARSAEEYVLRGRELLS